MTRDPSRSRSGIALVHGHSVPTVKDEDSNVFVAIKPICDALGIVSIQHTL